jgi:hypothetical protein
MQDGLQGAVMPPCRPGLLRWRQPCQWRPSPWGRRADGQHADRVGLRRARAVMPSDMCVRRIPNPTFARSARCLACAGRDDSAPARMSPRDLSALVSSHTSTHGTEATSLPSPRTFVSTCVPSHLPSTRRLDRAWSGASRSLVPVESPVALSRRGTSFRTLAVDAGLPVRCEAKEATRL